MRRLVLTLTLAGTLALPAMAADPGYHQPTVGSCRDYSSEDGDSASETSAPVDCTGPHRELTVAVERLPAGASFKRVLPAVGTACFKRMFETLGGTPTDHAMSAYDLIYFIPTKAERAQGARWVRCDLVLSGGRMLLQLPDPLLTRPITDSLRRCLIGGRGHLPTTCARPHRYRPSGVVVLHGRYPGQKHLTRIARRRCLAKTTSDPYRWTFASREAWRAGEKRIVCYTKTRR